MAETEEKKKSRIPQIAVLIIILCFVGYVVYDIITKQCVITEPEAERNFRITCAQGNTTVFTCTTAETAWTATTVDGVDVCQQPSSCVNANIDLFLTWIQENTLLGALAFIMIYIVATVLFIPGSILTIGAGVAFASSFNVGIGVLVGSLCVWIGANSGAALAFLLGRYLFRDWVAEKVKNVQTLSAIDKAINKQGFKTVLLLRLSPIIPFSLFNYMMSATSVKFPAYVAGSLLGMLPGTVAYVFIGAAVGGAASSNDTESCNPDKTLETILLVVGLIATFAAVVMISKFAKKEVDGFLDGAEEEEKTSVNKVHVEVEEVA